MCVLAQFLGVEVVESGNVHRKTNWILGKTKEWGERRGAAKGNSSLVEEERFIWN